MRFIYAYQTDKGRVRSENQDSLIVKSVNSGQRTALLAAVCDGVGGLSRGEWASRRAVEMLGSWADYELPLILKQEMMDEILHHRFRQLVQDINKDVFFSNQITGISSGTTLTAVLLWDYHYLFVHVGDSRLYVIENQVKQLTIDHSWVAREVSEGRMTTEDAKRNENQNVILQCIGVADNLAPQFQKGEIKGNTIFVLCTDGFWHCIKDNEWAQYFSPAYIAGEGILGENLCYLANQVKYRGESDNITAVAIKVF